MNLSIKVIINLILLSFIIFSCGNLNKFGENNGYLIDMNQAIVFKNGWGTNYNYPIILDLSNQIIEESNDIQTQIQNAVNTWNNAIGRTVLLVRTGFNYYTGNSFSTLYSPFNVVFKGVYYDRILNGQGGWVSNTGKEINTIATTILSFKSSEKIDFVSIRFNRDTYVFGDTKKEFNTDTELIADMESVALHELGHVLGLGHDIVETNSVMYPYIPVGPDSALFPTTSRCLSAKDVQRVREIYPGGQDPILNCQNN